MPRTYEIKSGDSKKKVADIFGVSVSDLLAYNKSTLGDSWEAGAEVRDPLEIPKLIKKSFDLGATPEQVARVLRIDVKTLKENYDVPESLSEVSVPKRKKAPTALLKAIAVEAKRVPTELLQEIIVDAKRVPEELLQDIVVPDRAKKILLENIEVPERDRVPEELLQEVNVDAKRVPKELLQDIVVPDRAKKILFENIEVPDREQKEVPAPYTDYTSTMDQRLTEVTTPERQQVPTELLQEVAVPDRELAEPLKSTGIVIPQSALDAINPPAKRRSPDDIVIPQSAIDIRRELANEEGKRLAALVTEAGEGVTLGLLGEIKAVIESATTDKTYDRAKAEYEVAREQFRANNPELAQLATPVELIATLPTGIGLARGLAKAGVTSIAAQAGIESSIYGVATGEGTENRLFQGVGSKV
jgi:hypothetical protein